MTDEHKTEPKTLAMKVDSGYNHYVKFGNIWLRAASVEAVAEFAGGAEIHMESGETYPSPWSAEDTLSLLSRSAYESDDEPEDEPEGDTK